jgi:hypothetical protein
LALRSGCATSFSVALSPTEKAAASLMEPLEREGGRALFSSKFSLRRLHDNMLTMCRPKYDLHTSSRSVADPYL